MFGRRKRRREQIRSQPFPPEWWHWIVVNVPYVNTLNEADQRELKGHIRVLLDEKRFEGCGGLEITNEIRVTIAAQAALLLLHRETEYYPTLKSILVYPTAFKSHLTVPRPDGTVIEGEVARRGESWFRGSLVLSWHDVKRGADHPGDGRNVVLHEFAHQLDGESGAMDGAPALPSSGCYRAWAEVLGDEYRDLLRSVHQRHHHLLDRYAATNPPEFFAVATEFFFEQPYMMRLHHPDLYEQLSEFYQQDPAANLG
ncbi:MAG: zinc-dependent peptidase [Planctomycetes bacterium]|nr:zinc-dependent peptidase [Planctomycetota bacterium]NOG53491.1 zinc-dependent peptidase [Planctomycetota bacterium]